MAQDPLSHDELVKKNARMGRIVLLIVLAMIGLSFAFIPLYNAFCRITGFDGTTIQSEQVPPESEIIDREVTIKFNADIHKNLKWAFKPEMREIKVKMGQRGVTVYSAENLTSAPLTGTALYNVTPLKAGKYFHKVQCFCFDEQTLSAREHVSMPVLFYIDPAMNDDPDMDDVKAITLSYNFYKIESKALEDATETFYNEGEE